MFTGIVQALGTILESAETGAGKRLTVGLGELAGRPVAHGDSVCVSGVCLTAVSGGGAGADRVQFDVITETLNRSTLGRRKVGDKVNLELSLQPQSYVGGHFLQGHVDAVGFVKAVQEKAADWRITFGFPREFAALIVPKGSVAVDGVSMTLAEVNTPASTFTLAVIPTTLAKTTLAHVRVGDTVNIETDIVARTVVHWLECMRAGGGGGAGGPGPDITLAKLQQLGFA
jgi:riboflavin synthase